MTPADADKIAAKVGAIAKAAGLKTVEDIQIPEGRIPCGIQQRLLLYLANPAVVAGQDANGRLNRLAPAAAWRSVPPNPSLQGLAA
jgi:hypothetical protein